MPLIDIKPEYLKELKKLLKEYVPDAEVWAYGSRVDGTGHDASDLDLVLRNPDDLTKRQENLFELREALSESNLPILIDVMDWAGLTESFYKEIETEYVVIQMYGSDSAAK